MGIFSWSPFSSAFSHCLGLPLILSMEEGWGEERGQPSTSFLSHASSCFFPAQRVYTHLQLSFSFWSIIPSNIYRVSSAAPALGSSKSKLTIKWGAGQTLNN